MPVSILILGTVFGTTTTMYDHEMNLKPLIAQCTKTAIRSPSLPRCNTIACGKHPEHEQVKGDMLCC